MQASKDESLRLWNAVTGLCIAVFGGHQGHRDEVLSMVRALWTPSPLSLFAHARIVAQDIHALGNCIASCGMDNTIKIWSLEDESLQQSIEKSYTHGRDESSATRGTFPTVFMQFPIFSTHKVRNFQQLRVADVKSLTSTCALLAGAC